jgi:enoyl-CoA hydratase
MDMILRSKKISGERALEIGLVHEIHPIDELKNKAIALGHELASQPAGALASMMKVLVNSSEKNLEELLLAERTAVHENNNTKDSQEGMLAFLEKRKPQFNK